MRFSPVSKSFLWSMSVAGAALLAATMTGADASTAATNQTIDFSQTSGALTDFSTFLTGPVAAVVAVLAVIGGAIMVINGQGMDGAVKNIGVIVITIGLLAGGASWYKGQAATIVGPDDLRPSSTSTSTSTAHVRAHVAPVRHVLDVGDRDPAVEIETLPLGDIIRDEPVRRRAARIVGADHPRRVHDPDVRAGAGAFAAKLFRARLALDVGAFGRAGQPVLVDQHARVAAPAEDDDRAGVDDGRHSRVERGLDELFRQPGRAGDHRVALAPGGGVGRRQVKETLRPLRKPARRWRAGQNPRRAGPPRPSPAGR